MIMEDWIWLGVLIAFLVGLFCWALWYARRQRALRDQPIVASASSNGVVSPDFVPRKPVEGLPHVWTFANGGRVYTNAPIAQFGPQEVRLADGSVVESSGDVNLSAIERDWSLLVTGGACVRIDEDSIFTTGDLTIG